MVIVCRRGILTPSPDHVLPTQKLHSTHTPLQFCTRHPYIFAYALALHSLFNKPRGRMNMAESKCICVQCVVCITGLLLTQCCLVTSEEVLLSRHRRQHDHDHDHDCKQEYFAEIGNYLFDQEITAQRASGDFAENHDQNITSYQVNILVRTLFSRLGCESRVDDCSQCSDDFVADLFTALSVDSKYGLSEDLLNEGAPLILYAVYRLEDVCDAGAGGTDLDEDAVFGVLMSAGQDGENGQLSKNDLEEILQTIGENYTAITKALSFDVESVFAKTVADHETGASKDEVHALSEVVVFSLLNGYSIGEASVPSPDDFVDAVFDSYATDGVMPEEEFKLFLSELGLGGKSDNETLDDAGISLDQGYGSQNLSYDALNVSNTCYSSEQILDIYQIDQNAGITKTQYESLLPCVVQQLLSGVCEPTEIAVPATYTNAQLWGISNLAVLGISLTSVIGACFVPFMSGFVYEAVIQFMMALAVATLTGDAFLHLIPAALGLHVHGAPGPSNPEIAYMWKCLLVEMAIYGLFLLERISGMLKCCQHSHSHGEIGFEMDETRNSVKALKRTRKVYQSDNMPGDVENGEEKEGFWKGCGTIPMMIVLGDSLHNFGDGLAIGASFTLGIPAGISTSIAIVCHEIPHELGDLAVLLNEGMRLSSAVLLNFVSALTCFLGLWVGIPLSQTDSSTREWILAATAGMFLYIGLVSMLPMLHAYKGKRKGFVFFLQNLGFLMGMSIILVIALFEGSINISL